LKWYQRYKVKPDEKPEKNDPKVQQTLIPESKQKNKEPLIIEVIQDRILDVVKVGTPQFD
jgi:hypothetical protein